jgi:hypothetical protein
MKKERAMKVVIRLSAKQEAKALPIILRQSPGMVLPDRTYILSEETLIKLRAEGIKYRAISRLPVNLLGPLPRKDEDPQHHKCLHPTQ